MPPAIDRFRLHANLDDLRERVLLSIPHVLSADVNDPGFILDRKFNPIAADFFLQQHVHNLLSYVKPSPKPPRPAVRDWLGDPSFSSAAWLADNALAAADWLDSRFAKNVYPLVRFRYGVSQPFHEELDGGSPPSRSRLSGLPPIFLPPEYIKEELKTREYLPFSVKNLGVDSRELKDYLKHLEGIVREYRSAVYPDHREGDIFKSDNLLQELENRQISLNLPRLLAPYFEALRFDEHVREYYNNLLETAKRGGLNEESLRGALFHLFNVRLPNLSAMAGYSKPDETGGLKPVFDPLSERIEHLVGKIFAENLVKPKDAGGVDAARFEKFRDLLKQEFLHPYNDYEFYRWRHSLITPSDVFRAVDEYKKYIDPSDLRVRAKFDLPAPQNDNVAAPNIAIQNIAKNIDEANRGGPAFLDLVEFSSKVLPPALLISLAVFSVLSVLSEQRKRQANLDRFNRKGKKRVASPDAPDKKQPVSEESEKSASADARFPASRLHFLRDFFDGLKNWRRQHYADLFR